MAPKDPVMAKFRACKKMLADIVDDGTMKIVESTLYDVCWYSHHIRLLQDEISSCGSIDDTPKGDRPSAQTVVLHTYMADKNACLKHITSVLSKGVAPKSKKDAFMDFIRS